MTTSSPYRFDLAGVGSPIVDLVATVPESFLANVHGEKGGMVLVDDAEMNRIVSLLSAPPALATGGSAANAAFNVARLGLRTTFVGKLGNDALAQAYVERFAAAAFGNIRAPEACGLSSAAVISLAAPPTPMKCAI